MFQQNIEKAPKLFEFQRLTLKYPYPEPIIYPANNNSQEKLTTKKTSMLSCLYFHLISKKRPYFDKNCLLVAY